ncbi:hypothetical protein B0H66DRAFT_595904 [Apodospora peruviana]|uniref:Uncharacterized protein n=1 Tax=Apodospora peruviana TaxID=516989 RepID=A0AAE0LYE6_9PEZI|nr:hypothetical protein B0H66DRAFT_595904 [Apodospora peruviana]
MSTPRRPPSASDTLARLLQDDIHHHKYMDTSSGLPYFGYHLNTGNSSTFLPRICLTSLVLSPSPYHQQRFEFQYTMSDELEIQEAPRESTRSELHQVAGEVIAILKRIPEYSDVTIAVMGGLAIWKYIDELPNYQEASEPPELTVLRKRLASLLHNRCWERGTDRLLPTVPYMPSEARKLRDIPDGTVPYISPTDLLVFKFKACSQRQEPIKRRTDVMDAETLVQRNVVPTPVNLTDQQKAAVERALPHVLSNGEKDQKWWRETLGLGLPVTEQQENTGAWAGGESTRGTKRGKRKWYKGKGRRRERGGAGKGEAQGKGQGKGQETPNLHCTVRIEHRLLPG